MVVFELLQGDKWRKDIYGLASDFDNFLIAFTFFS